MYREKEYAAIKKMNRWKRTVCASSTQPVSLVAILLPVTAPLPALLDPLLAIAITKFVAKNSFENAGNILCRIEQTAKSKRARQKIYTFIWMVI